MVDFKKLADKAKDMVEDRGGADSVKEDAGEVKDIVTGKGSLADKAKAAAAAIKDPGAEGDQKPLAKTEEQPKPKKAAGETAEMAGHKHHRKDHPA